jgi:8-oxo-dGTP diphosphatase
MEHMTQSYEPTAEPASGPAAAGPRSAAEPAVAPAAPDRPAKAVVAAVIERDGLFLAARRTEPPALAGLWEFPGGKVEPGEDDTTALIRECREELGVEIAVGEPVGPEYLAVGGRMVVRTYRAVLVAGEPAPIENHDELRWLAAGTPESRALPWLEGDYVILDALEAESMGAR